MIWSRILVEGRALCDGGCTSAVMFDGACDMIGDDLCKVRFESIGDVRGDDMLI